MKHRRHIFLIDRAILAFLLSFHIEFVKGSCGGCGGGGAGGRPSGEISRLPPPKLPDVPLHDPSRDRNGREDDEYRPEDHLYDDDDWPDEPPPKDEEEEARKQKEKQKADNDKKN